MNITEIDTTVSLNCLGQGEKDDEKRPLLAGNLFSFPCDGDRREECSGHQGDMMRRLGGTKRQD